LGPPSTWWHPWCASFPETSWPSGSFLTSASPRKLEELCQDFWWMKRWDTDPSLPGNYIPGWMKRGGGVLAILGIGIPKTNLEPKSIFHKNHWMVRTHLSKFWMFLVVLFGKIWLNLQSWEHRTSEHRDVFAIETRISGRVFKWGGWNGKRRSTERTTPKDRANFLHSPNMFCFRWYRRC